MKPQLIYSDDAEQMFDEYLDDAYEPINLGFGRFYASQILAKCDPIAYDLGFSEFCDNLVESANIYVKGYTDDLMPDEEDEDAE